MPRAPSSPGASGRRRASSAAGRSSHRRGCVPYAPSTLIFGTKPLHLEGWGSPIGRGSTWRCSVTVLGRGGRPGLLGERGDRQMALGGRLQHVGGLLDGSRVELDQEVHDDPVAIVVLVEPDVREELARAV